jgi:hypothetical protein
MTNSVSAAFWVMVALQTMGSVDMPGNGARKLPSPRAYVAIIVMFSTLHLVADAGAERAASAMAWVTVLVGLVKGPFGGTLTNFFNNIATNFAISPSATAPATASTTTAGATTAYPTPIPSLPGAG